MARAGGPSGGSLLPHVLRRKVVFVAHQELNRPAGIAPQAPLLRDIARALGETATLADAAPRMLAAVCEALGWEYGALFLVDRAGHALRCVGTWQQPHLNLDANFSTLARHLPAYNDARHVQKVMGSSGEIAVALSGPDTMSPTTYAWMRKADDRIISEHGDAVRPILSPPRLFQFLGGSPSASQLRASMRLLPDYLTSSVVRSDNRMAVMSYGVDIEDAVELGRLRDSIRSELPPAPSGTKVNIVGLPLVAVSAYDSLSGNRYLNAGLGIVAAGLVLTIGLARRRDALVAVASAVLTTGFILLGMFILHIGLNPITAAVGSLAAAVSCEFTVVLADAERRGRSHRSVLLAAAASATGYGVLAVSGVSSIRSFGLLLAVTVVVAAATARFVVWIAAIRPRTGEA